jgi:hypothetical protein
MRGWIGVDLDGTLAHYERAPVWNGEIGPPVARMVERVRDWLEAGEDVRIVTARVAPYVFTDGGDNEARGVTQQLEAIRAWCQAHLGRVLPVTCAKDFGMTVLWDDRVVQVIPNTGEPVHDDGDL